jgi:diaminopimelate epimerase
MTKHHGLGNDFLVVFEEDAPRGARWADLARRWCHRRTGIGADGLLVARAGDGSPDSGGVDVLMRLHNADGSEAEMSGNGIRCLVHAWSRRIERTEGRVVVGTGAGPRSVEYAPGPSTDTIVASVDMGPVVEIDEPDTWLAVGADPLRPVVHVTLGNPHTVVAVDDLDAIDLASLGRLLADVNLEVIAAGPERDAITMRVHERGVGITEACGTGACAAAWAAAAWGMVTRATTEITVHMAGGDAKVRLGQPSPDRVTLVGPATFVATIHAGVAGMSGMSGAADGAGRPEASATTAQEVGSTA